MVSQTHPVPSCMATIESALKDVADLEPVFMGVDDKRAALIGLSTLNDRLEELRLRVLGASADVAEADGARDAAAWLSHHGRRDRGECRRRLRLAQALDSRWTGVTQGLREGSVNLAQAEVIVRSLDALPDDLDAEIVAKAQSRLVDEAATFGPRELRVLGRRVIEVVAPKVAEDHEREALEREERGAARRTFLTTRRNGDGTTDIRMRVADQVADRLLTYLEAFTSPRKAPSPSPSPSPGQPAGPAPDDRRPYDQRMGHAFGAFLEAADPARMPLHGGDATAVFVTIDLETLRSQLGTALIGDSPITVGETRRLACNADLIPAVLGGASEVLDLGRSRRLFSPAQRRALALRDPTCRAEGCDIPAAWCEAHHAGQPWAQGGAAPTSPTTCCSAPSTTTARTTITTTPTATPTGGSDSIDGPRSPSR